MKIQRKPRPGRDLRRKLRRLVFDLNIDGWVPVAVALIRTEETGKTRGKVASLLGPDQNEAIAQLLSDAAEGLRSAEADKSEEREISQE